jgi:tetratricopeptide (TPR) repeat protein
VLIPIFSFSFLVFLPFCSPLFAEQTKPDIDEADNRVAADFERVKACLADRQWDEAVEILRRVMENSGDRLWPVTRWRYITVRDYCQLQLAQLPPEALALYRGLVDPPSETWYKEGIAQRDRAKLLLVARRAFAGSFGDDALLALGEMALERADYAAARGYWEKILPVGDTPNDAASSDKAAAWLSYPDTDIDPAAVRARLVLTSILEGSLFEGSRQRAQRELTQFKRLHPDAIGRFGGREANYAQALQRLLDQSEHWPPPDASPDWPTFAGTQWRDKIAALLPEASVPAWRIRLRDKMPDKSPTDESLLNFHPAVVGNLVFVATGEAILGLDLRTGKPAWGQAGPAIFRDAPDGGPNGGPGTARPDVSQHTLTVEGGRLFCRMDSPPINSPTVLRLGRPRAAGGGYLVCLDLQSEGRLLWRIEPENNDWAFEGTPVCDGSNVYVAMRLLGIRPQAYVACFDAQTGQRRWRRFVCGAESGARTASEGTSRLLLTLEGERIYYNTNLGAVAALSVPDGQLQWISTYPRAKPTPGSAKPPGGLRDPNPCLYHRGVLYVAPADSRRIFALDAVTGQILWQSSSQVEEARHLLGVADDKLIAAGKRLYWIETGREAAGKLKHVWPRTNRGPGFGRGVLAGQYVYFPTREKVFVFEQQSTRLVDSIELAPKNVSGGNLVVAGGRLLIATPEEIIVFAVR